LFFHDNPRNIKNLGGGVQCCRGFHSSFRVTQKGLSLNVGKFLIENALKFMLPFCYDSLFFVIFLKMCQLHY
jgi:hypothetical protein